MKTKRKCFQTGLLIALALALNPITQAAGETAHAPGVPARPVGQTNTPIPWDQIGAKAGANYRGDGLAVMPATDSARLHCVFQRLDGEATREGLWLVSTVTNMVQDRFQVKAVAIGRTEEKVAANLSTAGKVVMEGQNVSFVRAGLTEEYSVSMDGVRQDFVVQEKPAGSGELRVRLEVSGAKVTQTAYGAQLILNQSGRKIAYNRLRVTDATGKELPARMEAGMELAVVVNDAGAVYPVRIDPTFSDAQWISLGEGSGVDGTVNAAAVDGSGNLYIGGEFTFAGDVAATNIVEWNGNSWLALGLGISYYGSAVYALAVSGTNLYVGGVFPTAGGVTVNGIAQWNGSSWSALGLGIGGSFPEVLALAVSGGTVYAGGDFTTAGNITANYIAQWNGSSWSALGSGMNGGIGALAVSGSTLYVSGAFTTAGNITANYIAQWNGSSWSALGSGISGAGSAGYGPYVNALAVSGGTVYAGGEFSTAGGVAASCIAQWNGSSWSALGSGISGVGPAENGPYVNALAVSGTNLYAGGGFSTAGGVAASCIAQWNGSSWSALGSGISGMGPAENGPYVNALTVSGSTVYAGGDFTTANGVAADSIAQWNGSNWSVVGSGMGGSVPFVEALAVSGSTVYAGGDFTTAGDSVVNYIAQWNGSSWSALGSGMNGDVEALAVSGTNLYAGGDFTTAGVVAANYVARWNGSSWSGLGSGINGDVEALAISGTNLYAGGDFTNAGAVAANYVARWNGSSWSALGSGMSGTGPYVYALAVSGTNLYAGGNFTYAGGNLVELIAKWNGSSWSALGLGMGGGDGYGVSVNALAVSGTNLYAGGNFTYAGEVAATNIAEWNGSSWLALGSGMGGNYSPTVNALAVSGTNLYAGGEFTTAGGVAANYIAQWNGSSWSALGSGMNSEVLALAISGSDLYAGGDFTIAGTNVSANVAEAILDYIVTTPSVKVSSLLNPSVYGQSVTFTASVTSTNGTPTGSVEFQTNGVTFSVVSLSAGNAISAAITNFPAGTYTVTAVYTGNANFSSNSGTLAGGQVVNKASQTLAFTLGTPVSVTNIMTTSLADIATNSAASGIPVTYSNPPASSNVATVNSNSGLVTIVGVGTATIYANCSSNANYNAALQVSQTLTVHADVIFRLAIQTQPSTDAIAGTAFAQQPAILVEDNLGNVVSTDSGTLVTATSVGGAGSLQGTTSQPDVNGIVTFTNLSYNAGYTNINIVFAASGLTNATSTPVTVYGGPFAATKGSVGGVTSSSVVASFTGIPGYIYNIERATNVLFTKGITNWPSIVVPINDVISITDNFSDLGVMPRQAFYRLCYP